MPVLRDAVENGFFEAVLAIVAKMIAAFARLGSRKITLRQRLERIPPAAHGSLDHCRAPAGRRGDRGRGLLLSLVGTDKHDLPARGLPVEKLTPLLRASDDPGQRNLMP